MAFPSGFSLLIIWMVFLLASLVGSSDVDSSSVSAKSAAEPNVTVIVDQSSSEQPLATVSTKLITTVVGKGKHQTTVTTVVSQDAASDSDASSTDSGSSKPTSVSRKPSPKMARLNNHDKNLLRFLLTSSDEDSLYNLHLIDANNNNISVRLDLVQPDVWFMNGNRYLDCDSLYDWLEDYYSDAGSSTSWDYSNKPLPSEITTFNHVWDDTICYGGGAFFTSPIATATKGSEAVRATTATTTATSHKSPFVSVQTPTKAWVPNDTPFTIPYINSIKASGEFESTNLSVLSVNNEKLQLPDFSFVLVNETNVHQGGIGLAGNPFGSGFLDSLKANNFTTNNGYSLYFSDFDNYESSLGQLIPGAVDSLFVSGEFYQFDMCPYTGAFDQYENKAKLPIIQLDDIKIENSNTHESISLNTKEESVPVILDSRSYYSYLPLSVLVNLAVQTNAVYNSQIERWIVECDTITDNQPLINFVFGDLTLKLNLTKFTSDAWYNGQQLQFSNRQKACYLDFLPASISGYYSLGREFIEEIYLAVDNEGGKVAIGFHNTDIYFNYDDYYFTESPSSFATDSHSSLKTSFGDDTTSDSRSTTDPSSSSTTIAYIRSGDIPFATQYNYTSKITMTFGTASGQEDMGGSIPAPLSGAVIHSGQVYTGGESIKTSILPGMASAAKENRTSSKNAAAGRLTPFNLKSWQQQHQQRSAWDSTTLVGLIAVVFVFVVSM